MLQRFGHCHFVGIFQIAAHRQSKRYTAYFYSDRLEQF
jgi:hypothetical protein